MPLGVIRLRKLHASWVSTVGTNGRFLFTQPMSAVAHEVGTSGYMTRARNAHAQVAFSNSPLTDAQSMPSMLWKAMPTAKRTPISIPMFSRLSRLILSGGTSSTPVAVASSPRSVLSALPWCLTPLVSPAGRAAGCTTGMIAAARSLPSAPTTDATARSSPTSWALSTRSAASSRMHPVLLTARVGRAEVVERHVAVSSTTTRRPSRLPCAIPALCSASSCCHAAASTASVTRSGGSEPIGVPVGGSGDEHRGLGAAHARCARGALRARRRVRRA